MLKYSLALLAAIAAVEASPFPQAVTAAISPSKAAPSGCLPTFSGSFGIVNVNVTATSGASGGQATQAPDGQPGAGSTVSGAVKQTSDGQPQGGVTVAPVAVSQISDGQVQGATKTSMMVAVTQISDGQIQGPTVVVLPASQISDGQPQVAPQPKTTAISQISDGQPQGATGAVSQIGDGQPQAATGAVSQIGDGQPQAATGAVSQIGDGQPQAPKATGASQKPDGQPNVATGAGQAGDGQPTGSASGSGSSSGSSSIAFCQTDNTLALTLNNGVLKDAKGRTGYIAANFQFQFDAPPQAGAIFTAGFSVCSNGTLSLGGSSIFFQCLSGNFYNLYDRNWAPQCNAVYIQTGTLVKCS